MKTKTITINCRDAGDPSVGIWPIDCEIKIEMPQEIYYTVPACQEEVELNEEFELALAKFIGEYFEVQTLTEKQIKEEQATYDAFLEERKNDENLP